MAKDQPILNANMQNLTERYGDKAGEVFRELASLGGHGDVGEGHGQISENYAGGLGIDRKKDVDNHVGVGVPRTANKDDKS